MVLREGSKQLTQDEKNMKCSQITSRSGSRLKLQKIKRNWWENGLWEGRLAVPDEFSWLSLEISSPYSKETCILKGLKKAWVNSPGCLVPVITISQIPSLWVFQFSLPTTPGLYIPETSTLLLPPFPYSRVCPWLCCRPWKFRIKQWWLFWLRAW